MKSKEVFKDMIKGAFDIRTSSTCGELEDFKLLLVLITLFELECTGSPRQPGKQELF